jgi:hypothetical protein
MLKGSAHLFRTRLQASFVRGVRAAADSRSAHESRQSDAKEPPKAVVTIDLSDTRAVGAFQGDADNRESRDGRAYVYYQDKADPDIAPEFGYTSMGRTASGVDALLTMERAAARWSP